MEESQDTTARRGGQWCDKLCLLHKTKTYSCAKCVRQRQSTEVAQKNTAVTDLPTTDATISRNS